MISKLSFQLSAFLRLEPFEIWMCTDDRFEKLFLRRCLHEKYLCVKNRSLWYLLPLRDSLTDQACENLFRSHLVIFMRLFFFFLLFFHVFPRFCFISSPSFPFPFEPYFSYTSIIISNFPLIKARCLWVGGNFKVLSHTVRFFQNLKFSFEVHLQVVLETQKFIET